ncbi:enoyl-CoA hydratase-related protein [Bradyrhizobium sp. USDA 4461]
MLTQLRDAIAEVTLNRPGVRNALSIELVTALDERLGSLDTDPKVKVIVLRGSGGTFVAGADIREMLAMTPADVLRTEFVGCSKVLGNVTKPVIAAVEGYALGGGCELVEMSDIVIAAETATFGHPEVSLATMSAAGGIQRLSQLAGKAAAMDLLLTGRLIGAREAKSIGLVSRVVAPETFQAEVRSTAERLASYSLPVLRLIKQAVLRASQPHLDDGLQLEKRLFNLTFALEDHREGMEAFLERRTPHFRDR